MQFAIHCGEVTISGSISSHLWEIVEVFYLYGMLLWQNYYSLLQEGDFGCLFGMGGGGAEVLYCECLLVGNIAEKMNCGTTSGCLIGDLREDFGV